MKILVTLPNSYKENEAKGLNAASEHLRRQGHNVFSDQEIRQSIVGNKKSDEIFEKYFSEIDKKIKDVDILITDITIADIKVGYEIGRALDEKKIVIALEKESSKASKVDKLLIGNGSRILIRKTYKDNTVSAVIDNAIEEAKSKMDTKFILIISSEIDRYLDWASGTKRMHKAQIVRNAIENSMNKDREYKNYLNN